MIKNAKQYGRAGIISLLLATLPSFAGDATAKDVMCLKTNTGQYVELVRVSMLVIPDGGAEFEIVVRDGEGLTGVTSVTFEKHESDIDLSKYQGGTNANDGIDLTKPVWLVTNTGCHFLVKDVSMLARIDAEGTYEVVTASGNETGVKSVGFFRGNESDIPLTGIETVKELQNVEQLTLQTAVSEQLALSGCGDAATASVYALDGSKVAEEQVKDGAVTIHVGHLTSGVYIVKVGNKALKFMKK